MITNCSGERSFSKLKFIKNRLRTSMTQERLCHLTLMSIESDILDELDLSDIIDDFACRKSRKKNFKTPPTSSKSLPFTFLKSKNQIAVSIDINVFLLIVKLLNNHVFFNTIFSNFHANVRIDISVYVTCAELESSFYYIFL